MTTYNLSLSADQKTVYISVDGDATPAETTDIGSFEHDDDEADILGPEVSHVFYQHVQDALYKTSKATGLPGGFFPDNITNMQNISIERYGPNMTYSYMSVDPAAVSVEEAATQQLTTTVYDDEDEALTVTGITYTSADEAVATVSASGLVTGVAAGETEITVKFQTLTTVVPTTVTEPEE